MAFEKYTIEQFKNAFFFEDYSQIDKDTCKVIYDEYIDKARLYEEEEFHKVGYITYLNGRINYIKLFMRLQREFINNFGFPFVEAFSTISKKYGYYLKWNHNTTIEDFEKQLKSIEEKEKKYESELDDEVEELVKMRLKKRNKDTPVKLTLESFLRTISLLKKIGWNIDKKNDTMQELAIAIEEQSKEKRK